MRALDKKSGKISLPFSNFGVKSYWFIRKSSELLTLILIFLLGCLLQCFVLFLPFFTHPELNKMYRYCICCLYCVYRFVSPNHDSFDIFKDNTERYFFLHTLNTVIRIISRNMVIINHMYVTPFLEQEAFKLLMW